MKLQEVERESEFWIIEDTCSVLIGCSDSYHFNKKSKDATSEEVEKEWVEFKEIKVQEIEQLKEFTLVQQEKNRLKKMKLYVKLSSEEHLGD